MAEYSEDEYLLLSGIQHFVFCRRQWALIHIEQQWSESFLTADGRAMHKNVHDSGFDEKRRDVIITRGMAVSSASLGLSGECDVVEFRRCEDGISLFNYDGKYSVMPIEYKRGLPKDNESDMMQLCAQAMCLEEMLCCEISEGCLFYGESRKRLRVHFDDGLRERTKSVIKEMHLLYSQRYTPKVRKSKSCAACSLKDLCLPNLMKGKSAKEYIRNNLKGLGEEIEEAT